MATSLISPITSKGTIRSSHPICGEFADCSSKDSYYDFKGEAVCAFDDALAAWGLQLDPDDLSSFYGDEGRKRIEVQMVGTDDDVRGDVVGIAIIFWYRVPSGRWEFTGYLA